MWERFSYYGMRAFLILYMVAPVANGGLGFADADAASIYGTLHGSAWGASIVGGLIADRFLGIPERADRRRSSSRSALHARAFAQCRSSTAVSR
jgi:hypothetical protein